MVMPKMVEIGKKGEGEAVRRLMELISEEQTWAGRYYGHSGQARQAEREIEYWEDVLAKMGEDVEDFVKRKWQRHLEKAKARKEYHLKMAVEAKVRLRQIREQINKLIGGEEE